MVCFTRDTRQEAESGDIYTGLSSLHPDLAALCRQGLSGKLHSPEDSGEGR